MPGPKRQPIEERFTGYLIKAGDDESWGWTGPVTNKGHPTIGRGGKGAGQMSARTLAYQLAFGTEPDREVLNTCDAKCCLNPRHLVLAGGAKSKATLRKRFDARVAKVGRTNAGSGSRSRATPDTVACRWGAAITLRWPTAWLGSLQTAPSLRGCSSANDAEIASAATRPTSSCR